MNLFYLSHNPVEAAQFVFDSHAVKMPLESMQMLSTNVAILMPDFKHEALMKPTHANHPSTVWARTSSANFKWTVDNCEALFAEYTKRYGKVHASQKRFEALKPTFNTIMQVMPNKTLTAPALAMPDDCKMECPVNSYRKYYKHKEAVEQTKASDINYYKALGCVVDAGGKKIRKLARKMVWNKAEKPFWA